MIQETQEGSIITVYVQPNARKTEYVGVHGTAIKFRVASPPVGGAANEDLCWLLSCLFSIPKGKITVCVGHGGRRKRIKLQGVCAQKIREILNVRGRSLGDYKG